MSYRLGIGSRPNTSETLRRKHRLERRRLLEVSQAMLVWYMRRRGSGDRPHRLKHGRKS